MLLQPITASRASVTTSTLSVACGQRGGEAIEAVRSRGAVLGRAEAQVLRLACVYAVLDKSKVIELSHLEATLAVWEYAEASAEYVFGDSLGNPDADRILTALRSSPHVGNPDADRILTALRSSPHGLTRTEISGLFGRNLSAERIESALAELQFTVP